MYETIISYDEFKKLPLEEQLKYVNTWREKGISRGEIKKVWGAKMWKYQEFVKANGITGDKEKTSEYREFVKAQRRNSIESKRNSNKDKVQKETKPSEKVSEKPERVIVTKDVTQPLRYTMADIVNEFHINGKYLTGDQLSERLLSLAGFVSKDPIKYKVQLDLVIFEDSEG